MVDAQAVHKVSSNVYTYMVNDQQDLFLLFSKTYSFNATEAKVKEGRWGDGPICGMPLFDMQGISFLFLGFLFSGFYLLPPPFHIIMAFLGT